MHISESINRTHRVLNIIPLYKNHNQNYNLLYCHTKSTQWLQQHSSKKFLRDFHVQARKHKLTMIINALIQIFPKATVLCMLEKTESDMLFQFLFYINQCFKTFSVKLKKSLVLITIVRVSLFLAAKMFLSPLFPV